MWLTTLRKAAEFVRDVVTLAFLFSPIIAFAVSAAVGTGRRAGVLGRDGEVAFITVCGIGLVLMFIAARWRQAARREDEAARLEAKRQAEEKRREGERKREEAPLQVRGQMKADQEQAAWAEAKKRQDEAERLEAKRKAEEARQAEKERLAAERAIRRIEANPDDSVAIDDLRKLRWNDKRFLRLSVVERDRIDDFLLKVRQREDARQADTWQGTGGPPKPGRNWIRQTWPNEATDFTPWLARHLELVSACTGLDLHREGTEVYAGGGRADIVARDNKSASKVVIENQLDSADGSDLV